MKKWEQNVDKIKATAAAATKVPQTICIRVSSASHRYLFLLAVVLHTVVDSAMYKIKSGISSIWNNLNRLYGYWFFPHAHALKPDCSNCLNVITRNFGKLDRNVTTATKTKKASVRCVKESTCFGGMLFYLVCITNWRPLLLIN